MFAEQKVLLFYLQNQIYWLAQLEINHINQSGPPDCKCR